MSNQAFEESRRLWLRQRQIARELKRIYDRDLREPVPGDMLELLVRADNTGDACAQGRG